MNGADRGGAEPMPAGRALDEMVAERVMGLPLLGPCVGRKVYKHPTTNGSGNYFPGYAAVYSTDMIAAWDVVDAMIGRGFFPDLSYSHGGWTIGMGRAGDLEAGEDFWVSAYASANTAPLAICRAALAAAASAPSTPNSVVQP